MRQKQGGNLPRVNLEDIDLAATTDDPSLLLVNESLGRLQAVDPVGAELIRLRFFAGLSNGAAAELLDLPDRSAKRVWAYARAWLYEDIRKHF
jgi:hypothetical protein